MPDYSNRKPEAIVMELNRFESSGRIFKALSWLDYAKRENCISALEYAALETRLAIEQLIFEQLIVVVGTALEVGKYKECTGKANKLAQLIKKLIPKYEQLIEFTKALAPANLPISKWDNKELVALSGKVSNYLHWSGALDVTIQSASWFTGGIETVEKATQYIWHGLTTGNTAVMTINKLEPEIYELWNLYQNNTITIDTVIQKAAILQPMLKTRRLERLEKVLPHPNT